ncbi:MAG TPA: alpha/beta hydrolase, partial [Thermoleophilaceae bacterium]|nr:alpha/beta hydrolase [Thermoleophilaceae bacterium]
MRDPIFRGEEMRDGRGRAVLLIPGFLAGDGSLGLMAGWLKRAGYRPVRAGMRANVDCSGAALERLEQRLEGIVTERGTRAAVVGQSRGGGLAKALAARRPDLIRGIVTLGSPQIDPLAVHPLVRLQVEAVSRLGSLGAPGLFKRSCLDGDCCAGYWQQIADPCPDGVGFVSIYSRSDGIVDWRACLD